MHALRLINASMQNTRVEGALSGKVRGRGRCRRQSQEDVLPESGFEDIDAITSRLPSLTSATTSSCPHLRSRMT